MISLKQGNPIPENYKDYGFTALGMDTTLLIDKIKVMEKL